MIPQINTREQLIATLTELNRTPNLTEERVQAFIRENRKLLIQEYRDPLVTQLLAPLISRFSKFSADSILSEKLGGLNIKSSKNEKKESTHPRRGIEKKKVKTTKEKNLAQINKEMLSLKELGCRNARAAIEYAIDNSLRGVNLQGLRDITDAHIDEMLDELKLVTGFKLSSDLITERGVGKVAQLPDLHTLWVASDNVQTLDLRNAVNLRELYLSGKFRHIALPHSGKLENVKLIRCHIEQFDLPDSVQKLWIDSCVNLVQLIGKPGLKEVLVQGCTNMRVIKLDASEKLKEALILGNHNLVEAAFPQRLDQLKKIEVEGNRLERLMLPETRPMDSEVIVRRN